MVSQIGSSPRLRGTLLRARKSCELMRFIPAPAGNTCSAPEIRTWQPVHPRACGEHDVRKPDPRVFAGSSPRLRGTQWECIARHLMLRFIPAPAGNTAIARSVMCLSSVHPRACGEHCVATGFRVTIGGSSPRLRGTRGRCRYQGRLRRFIPAPAGNTIQVRSTIYPRAVHPRACGEHVLTVRR